jgi:Pyruvate/2-oxoacid:ferredoxin oxidoreductase gamma subunit
VAKGGTVIVDETVTVEVEPPEGVTLIRWPAIRMAEEMGVAKAANTMMLAALKKYDLTKLSGDNLEKALVASFAKKPQLGEKNRELLRRAEALQA